MKSNWNWIEIPGNLADTPGEYTGDITPWRGFSDKAMLAKGIQIFIWFLKISQSGQLTNSFGKQIIATSLDKIEGNQINTVWEILRGDPIESNRN